MSSLLEEIRELTKVLKANIILLKEVLNVEETAQYLGISVSRLYTLVNEGEIPHFKRGKILQFDKGELNQWCKQNRVPSNRELQVLANTRKYKNN